VKSQRPLAGAHLKPEFFCSVWIGPTHKMAREDSNARAYNLGVSHSDICVVMRTDPNSKKSTIRS
jgi:hypothetical protein